VSRGYASSVTAGLRSLPARLRRHEMTGQFVRYATIGCMNVAMFLVLFNVLLFAGLPVLGANAVAFLVTSVNSFTWNKLWAFRDPRTDAVVRQYLVFVGFTLIGLGLNSGVLYLLLIPLEPYGRIGSNVAAILALPVSIVWNFTAYRRWIFSGERDSVAA
jgi:putative flippase GtrA